MQAKSTCTENIYVCFNVEVLTVFKNKMKREPIFKNIFVIISYNYTS